MIGVWKRAYFSLFLLLMVGSVQGQHVETFQKLSSSYTISYGDPRAPIHAIEYFSLSCPKCLGFLKREFYFVQKKYIDVGRVYWTFHPDPADLLTLQAMICCKDLSPKQKRYFLEEVVSNLHLQQIGKESFFLQELMEELGSPLPKLRDLQWIEGTQAFQEAYSYISQQSVPTDLPSIEINGILYEEFPNFFFLNRVFSSFNSNGGTQK